MKTHWISEANITRRERKHLAGRNTWHTYAKTQANRAVRRAAREEIDDGLAEMDEPEIAHITEYLTIGDVFTHYRDNPVLCAVALSFLLDMPYELERYINLFCERRDTYDPEWDLDGDYEYYLSDGTLFAHEYTGIILVTQQGWDTLHQQMNVMPIKVGEPL
jgi:hypothetical protein